MKFFLLFLLLLTTPLLAQNRFACQVMMDTRHLFSETFTIPYGHQNFIIGELDEFVFFMSSRSKDIFELQILDRQAPSRSYAMAQLSPSSPLLGMSIWKREFLIDIQCQLKP
jgi:hypothetical protein